RQAIRKKAADDLKLNAQWWKAGTDSATVTTNVAVIRGSYKALRDRLGRSLFAVKVVRDQDKRAVDLDITLEDDLPPPNDTPSQEKQELFVQLNNASAVIRTVCQQIIDRAGSWFRKITLRIDTEAIRRARSMQDEYIDKLARIGHL